VLGPGQEARTTLSVGTGGPPVPALPLDRTLATPGSLSLNTGLRMEHVCVLGPGLEARTTRDFLYGVL